MPLKRVTPPDPVDFVVQCLELGVEIGAVTGGVGPVGRLDGELAHALEHVADLGQTTLGSLRQRDAVLGVADGNVHSRAPCVFIAFRDGKACGVVLRAVHLADRTTAGSSRVDMSIWFWLRFLSSCHRQNVEC